MPGGCWICNPMCGRCKPPAYKAGHCENCGTMTLFDKATIIAGGPLPCKQCGADQSEEVRPKVTRCNYSGKLCAYSCGNSTATRHDYGDQRCELNTPPDEAWLAAHPDAADLFS